MARLFGTDGVSGKAGEHPLDPATIRRLGGALVRALRHENSPSREVQDGPLQSINAGVSS